MPSAAFFFYIFLAGGLELVLAAIAFFFTVFALTYFFGGFIISINIGLAVVEVASGDVILGIEVVVEVVVKVAVRPWPWAKAVAGAAIPAAVLTGLPFMGSLLLPIKKVRILRTG